MSWAHIQELRNCLVIIAVSYVLAAAVCYYFAPEFITWAIDLAEGYTFVQTGVAELLAQYIKVALITGVVVDMPIILWNIDTRDWDHKNAQKTINEVMSKVKDGDIILMHELYNATADASDYLIPTLTAKGYQLVTVSELAQYKGVTLQPNKVYYSF